VKWKEVATRAPELAAVGESELTCAGLIIVATLRADGSPRVSFAEAVFIEANC
jgi:hypothetical protein